jgi:glycine oxidase
VSATLRVVIAGGGAIGCAVAWEAALRGMDVTVVERGIPGREATWASAGMISPSGHTAEAGPFVELAIAGLRGYPGFIERLREYTAHDPVFEPVGKLVVAITEGEAEELREFKREQAGRIEVALLGGDDARVLEPALSEDIVMAAAVADDYRLDNVKLGEALWDAAARAGVRFELGQNVETVLGDGERVQGVRLAAGGTINADRVVIAAGAWSAGITGMPRRLPVVPVRGQMLALRTVPPLIRRSVHRGSTYLVPRVDGRMIVGSTKEPDAGFRAQPTALGVRTLLDGALAVLPELAEAPLLSTWAGLRPGTPDNLPILGADPELEGLVYATGHFRNGILLAPITGELIADVLAGETPSISLEPYRVTRFDGDA